MAHKSKTTLPSSKRLSIPKLTSAQTTPFALQCPAAGHAHGGDTIQYKSTESGWKHKLGRPGLLGETVTTKVHGGNAVRWVSPAGARYRGKAVASTATKYMVVTLSGGCHRRAAATEVK